MKNDAMDGKKCGNNIFVTVFTQKLYFNDECLAKFRGVNSVYAQNMNSWREKMKRKTQKDMCVCENTCIWLWKTFYLNSLRNKDRAQLLNLDDLFETLKKDLNKSKDIKYLC